VLGAAKTGKTTLVKMFVEDQLKGAPAMTIGAVVFRKNVTVDGVELELALWDVEEPKLVFTTADSYFSGTKGVVIVYDVTRKDTLEHAVQCCKKCTVQGLIHIPRILIGNKQDLDAERVITSEEGDRMADHIHAEHYEVSAINGDNVQEAFLKMASMIREISDVISW